MRTLRIGGATYTYDEAGRGSPLLLLHSGITDRRMWNEALPLLARRHRVVCPDLRGYGDTPLPPGPFAHAADIIDLLEALDIPQAHVCGVSHGASVTLDLAVARPDRVDRLVLVAPNVPGWESDASSRAFDDAETAALERDDLDEASWLNVRFWVDGPHRSPDDVDANLRERVHAMQRRVFEMDDPRAQEEWLVPDWQEQLSHVAAPSLVVVGALDQPRFIDMARHVARQLPDARLDVRPGLAHLPPMEAPDAFAGLVLDHLAR